MTTIRTTPYTPHRTDVRQRVTPEEWETRTKLAAAYRLAAMFRWTDHIYTHFSARVPGPEEHFLINPYGLLFDEITASSLIKVDVDGTVLDDPLDLGINQAGFVIHSAIHKARPDLQAVLHTHTRDGIAVSAQRNGLLPISQHALMYYSRVAYHAYEGIALDLDEQTRLVNNLGSKSIMILRNHGLLVGGSSVERAFQDLQGLERACGIQIAAQTGASADLLQAPASAIERVQHQIEAFLSKENDPGTKRHWDALIRQLEREGEDYKR